MMSSDCLPHLLLGSDVLRPNHCLAGTCQAFSREQLQLSECHLHGAGGSGGVGDGGGGNQGRMGKRLEISPVGKRVAVVSTCIGFAFGSGARRLDQEFGMRRMWDLGKRPQRNLTSM